MSDDRRDFFKKVAGGAVTLAGVEAVLEATGTTAKAGAALAADRRSFVSGRFALELDGVAALVQSVEGGDAHADVVEEPPGDDCFARKHLANVKYEDITITCGTGMTSDFYAWLQSFFGCEPTRKDGAIVALDFKSTERSRRTFTQALLTEIGFPACDGASKDSSLMTVKWSPEVTRRVKGSGKAVSPCGGAKVQKRWLPANFRLTIDGLDCTKVNKVDAFTVRRKLLESPVGDQRDFGREPGTVEVPNLVVTLPESQAQSFFDWHEEFVIKGNSGAEEEKDGKLEYLAPNLADVLFTIEFHNLGIFKLAPEKGEAGGDQIQRVTAEMYCEQMTFTPGKGVGC
jgi:tail tube protein gp19